MSELHDLKVQMLEMKAMLSLLLPSGDTPIAEIARKTGKSRQGIRDYVINHYEPDVEWFKKEDGKLYVSESVAIELLQRKKT